MTWRYRRRIRRAIELVQVRRSPLLIVGLMSLSAGEFNHSLGLIQRAERHLHTIHLLQKRLERLSR